MEDVASTGIGKIDDMLGGGFPTPGITLVVGPTGIGKTLLTLQWLAEGAKKGENVIYISTTVPVSRIKHYYSNMLFLKDVVDKILWYDMPVDPRELLPFTDKKKKVFHRMLIGEVLDENLKPIRKVHRVAIDSMTSIEMAIGDSSLFRLIATKMVHVFNKYNIATVLVEESDPLGKNPWGEMRNFAEAVICMDYITTKNSIIRALKIVKRYGIEHPLCWIPFNITDEGIKL